MCRSDCLVRSNANTDGEVAVEVEVLSTRRSHRSVSKTDEGVEEGESAKAERLFSKPKLVGVVGVVGGDIVTRVVLTRIRCWYSRP
jgi:hypothetical protein